MSKFDRAIGLALWAHEGQMYGPDKDYFSHLWEVMIRLAYEGEDEETQIVGILHDIIEDTSINYSVLQHEFGRDVAHDVWMLSKYDLSYNDYLKHLKTHGSERAKKVKIADIRVNLAACQSPDCPEDKKHLVE